jgi:hypothetical protein
MSHLPPKPVVRSRSRSPEYRQRRYSPSRAVSPLPSRRYDSIPPPLRRYDDGISARPMGERRDDPSPPRHTRRYHDYSPPPLNRSRDNEYSRQRSPPRFRSRSRSRSPGPIRSKPYSRSRSRSRSPPPRSRMGAEDFYEPPPGRPVRRDDTFVHRETWRPEGRVQAGQKVKGMAADHEELVDRPSANMRSAQEEQQWERGRDVSELEVGRTKASRVAP